MHRKSVEYIVRKLDLNVRDNRGASDIEEQEDEE